MSPSLTLPRGASICHLPAPLHLACGGELGSAVLAFERQGPPGAPVVVVAGGISAGRHVSAHENAPQPGFWDDLVGRDLAIDTARFQVLAVDWLGGAGASTAPPPHDARPLAGRGERAGPPPFPAIDSSDQADAIAHLCDRLGIERLHAWIGSSYGGMVGLSFAARHPQRLDRLLAIAAADRAHPLASAWRRVQCAIVRLGLRRGCAAETVALARQLAMTTYRSAEEFAARFDDGDTLQSWLDWHGSSFAQRFDAHAFLCLCESIDAHRVDAAAVRVPTSLVAFDTDQLVPATQVRDLAARLRDLRRLDVLRTPFGHDAFLKEAGQLAPILREVLS